MQSGRSFTEIAMVNTRDEPAKLRDNFRARLHTLLFWTSLSVCSLRRLPHRAPIVLQTAQRRMKHDRAARPRNCVECIPRGGGWHFLWGCIEFKARFRFLPIWPFDYGSFSDGMCVCFQATRQFLEEINKWTSQHGVSPLSRELAVKFLMARKFDVLRAIELFHSYRVRRRRRSTVAQIKLTWRSSNPRGCVLSQSTPCENTACDHWTCVNTWQHIQGGCWLLCVLPPICWVCMLINQPGGDFTWLWFCKSTQSANEDF